MSLKSTILASVGSLIVGASAVVAPAIASEDFRTTMGINTTDKAIILEQEETIKDQRIEMQSIEEARRTLLAEKTTLQTRVESLTLDKQTLSTQIANLQNQKANLQTSLANTQNELETTKTTLSNKETELANANEDLNTLNSTLAEKETLLEEKQTALDNAIANGELQAEEIANKQVEILNLQTNISTLNEQKTELENTVENLRNNVEELKTQKNNLQSQVNTLSSERDNLQVQLNTKTEELATLTTQLEEANNRIAELEASVNVRVSYDFYDCVVLQFMHPTEGWGGGLGLLDETREPAIRHYRYLDCLVNYNTSIEIQQIRDTHVYDSDNYFIADHSEGLIVCSSETYGETEYELNLTFVDKEGNVVDINTLNQDMNYSLYYKTYSIETDSNNSRLLTKLDVTIVIEEYVY